MDYCQDNWPTPENCEQNLSELFEEPVDVSLQLSQLGVPDFDNVDQNTFISFCFINKMKPTNPLIDGNIYFESDLYKNVHAIQIYKMHFIIH